MNLIKEQMERLGRLEALQAHISDKDNHRMYVSRPDKITITADQVREVQRRLADGQAIINITRDTGISEYHVRGVRRRRYDFLLK